MKDNLAAPGFWDSPLTAESILASPVKFSHLHTNPDHVFYLETRAQEKGRSVLMDVAFQKEFLATPFNIKTRVNEYGGKCYTVLEHLLIFFDLSSQTIYKKDLRDLTLLALYKKQNCYFADLCIDPSLRYLYAVMEDQNEPTAPAFLIRLDLSSGNLEILHSSEDFYAQPRISPCGHYLAFISWNHPHMPWDENRVWLAKIGARGLQDLKMICSEKNSSCDQLFFGLDSRLYFTWDMQGYSHLYTFSQKIEQLTFLPINFGTAHWIYGIKRVAQIDCDHLALIGTSSAQDDVYLLHLKTLHLNKLQTPLSSIADLASQGSTLYCIGATPSKPSGIYKIDAKRQEVELMILSEPSAAFAPFISIPREISCSDHEKTFHGFYYPPCHPEHCAEMAPPLILKVHSGPTAHAAPRYQPEITFFTSRGFAYFEINYRGSTGYSKAFQTALNKHWGEIDVEDTLFCAQMLVKKGLACEKGLFIKGSSSGGFTAMSALCQSKIFTGGVCYYGVYDLVLLASHTHKFERFYLETLIGSFSDNPTLFYARSPAHQIHHLTTPVLLFHGDKDVVVPEEQTKNMYLALQKKKTFVDYICFPDEGHGFKLAKTLQKCLTKELEFYQVLLNT